MTLDPPDVVPELPADSDLVKHFGSRVRQITMDPMTYGHEPHTSQIEVLRSTSQRKLLVAANRVGKTECGMRDALWLARGNHKYRRALQLKNIWIGCPDFPSYLRFHKPAFDEWCPKAWLTKFHETDRWADIRRADGRTCRISFLSYDMDRTKWQGAGVGHIWLDEEPPEDIVNESLARLLTTNGSMLISFAPIEGQGWWYDRLWTPALAGLGTWTPFKMPMARRQAGAPLEVGESLVPHISTEDARAFAAQFPDEAERAARVFGEAISRTGLVYKTFRHEIHVVPGFKVPKHFEVFGAVDPGYHGFGFLLGAIAPTGELYVPQEYFSQQHTTRERFADMLALLEETVPLDPQDGLRTCVCWVDTEDPQVVLELNTLAAAMAEKKTTGWTLAFASLDQGLKARKAGFLRVQQLLQPEPDRPTPPSLLAHDGTPLRPPPPEGEPSIYFFRGLWSQWRAEDGAHEGSRLLWEIEHYAWKKPSPGKVQPDDAHEASAHGAHLMAVLRYLCMSRLGAPDEPAEDIDKNVPVHLRSVWKNFDELIAQAAEAEANGF